MASFTCVEEAWETMFLEEYSIPVKFMIQPPKRKCCINSECFWSLQALFSQGMHEIEMNRKNCVH